MLTFHTQLASLNKVITFRLRSYLRRQTLQSGNLPPKQSMRGRLGPALSHLRLLMIYTSPTSPPLTSSQLSDLRSGLGVRIGYALTARDVAGAVAQTNILDYRVEGGMAHFGPPLSCVEVKLVGEESEMEKMVPKGRVSVKGPSVVGGETVLEGVEGSFGEDNTLSVI
jgi:hypothetical protein